MELDSDGSISLVCRLGFANVKVEPRDMLGPLPSSPHAPLPAEGHQPDEVDVEVPPMNMEVFVEEQSKLAEVERRSRESQRDRNALAQGDTSVLEELDEALMAKIYFHAMFSWLALAANRELLHGYLVCKKQALKWYPLSKAYWDKVQQDLYAALEQDNAAVMFTELLKSIKQKMDTALLERSEPGRFMPSIFYIGTARWASHGVEAAKSVAVDLTSDDR
jgi:hypothetical protein